MAGKKLTPEGAVTKAIRDILHAFDIFHWKEHQGLGSAPGVADILGIYEGRMLAIEVKAPGKRVKPGSHQERFLLNIEDRGGIAFQADGVEALARGFERYGYKLPILL